MLASLSFLFLIESIAGIQVSYSQQALFLVLPSGNYDVVALECDLPVVGRQRQTVDKIECIVPVRFFGSGFMVEKQTAVNRISCSVTPDNSIVSGPIFSLTIFSF